MKKIITAEVEFRIRIQNQESSFGSYRSESYRSASRRLGYDYYNDNIADLRNPLQAFIREKVKEVAKSDEMVVFFTDYSEREGSFILSFSFFVFATFMSYGSFRESLDYLRDDLNFFFKDTFPNNTDISVNYDIRQNITAHNLARQMQQDIIAPIKRQFNVLKAIVGVVAVFSIGFSFYSVYKAENNSSSLTNDTIEKAVNIEIERINSRKTNEEILRLLNEIRNDTARRTK